MPSVIVFSTAELYFAALGKGGKTRQAAYRRLFRAALDKEAIDDLLLAPNQNQPLGDSRFDAKVDAMTAQRRERKLRGRPRSQREESQTHDAESGKLPV